MKKPVKEAQHNTLVDECDGAHPRCATIVSEDGSVMRVQNFILVGLDVDHHLVEVACINGIDDADAIIIAASAANLADRVGKSYVRAIIGKI
jgi:hypothetical protein